MLGRHNDNEMDAGQYLVLPLIISVLAALALGLVLVWLNIERTQFSYDLRQLQREADTQVERNGKLTVDREKLLSPQWLGTIADTMGLEPAKPGQMRRMGK